DYGVAHVEWPGQLTRYDASLGLPRAALATVRIHGELLAATTRGMYRVAPPAAGSSFVHFAAYAPTRTTLFAIRRAGDPLLVASGDGVYAVRDGVQTLIDAQLAYSVCAVDASGQTLLAGGLEGARLLRRDGTAWSAHALPNIDSEIRHLLT